MPDDHAEPKRSFWLSAPFLSGTAALITAVVAVAGLFLPEDKPDPAPPPAMFGDIVEVQSGRHNPCCEFSVQVKLSGFKNHDCTLLSTLINTADGSETPGYEVIFTPEGHVDQARASASVPAMTAGTYIARFVLYDPDRVELDRFETKPFRTGQ
jgi:hypothetical protein